VIVLLMTGVLGTLMLPILRVGEYMISLLLGLG